MTSSETTLDWIDAALDAGAPTTTDPVGHEVQELALALRAEAPEPDPGFAESLGDRVDAGFPRRARLPRRRVLALGGGLAAATAAAAIAVVVVGGPQHPSTPVASQPARSPSAPPVAVQERVPIPEKGPGKAALRQPNTALPPETALPSGAARSLFAPTRRVERSATLTLAAPETRLRDVADGVVAVTGRHHGFVEHEDLSTGGPQASGSLELRVPVAELDATLRDVSGLAHVRARTETADDVTRRYSATNAGLAQARRKRADLLRRIAHAPSPAEADRLRAALAAVDSRIRSLTSAVRTLNRETNFADVQVTLQVDRHGAVTGSSTRRALHDALAILVGAIDFGIRALAVLIPLALVAAALLAVLRTLRRRRREAVLA